MPATIRTESDNLAANWFNNVTGLAATPQQVDWWSNKINTMGAEAAYQQFLNPTNSDATRTQYLNRDVSMYDASRTPSTGLMGGADALGNSYYDTRTYVRPFTGNEVTIGGENQAATQSDTGLINSGANTQTASVGAAQSTAANANTASVQTYNPGQYENTGINSSDAYGRFTGRDGNTNWVMRDGSTWVDADNNGVLEQRVNFQQSDSPLYMDMPRGEGEATLRIGQGSANDLHGWQPTDFQYLTDQGNTSGTNTSDTEAYRPGLMQSGVTEYNAAGPASTEDATASGYTAQTGGNVNTYTPNLITDQESVSDAVNRIISQDSPLMQRSRARAQEAANARGMQNSGLAVQAGEAAVLDAALPMAQGDVQASLAVKQANQGATNTASQFNAQQSNALQMFSAEQTNAANQFRAAAENAASSQNAAAYNQSMRDYQDALNTAARFNATAQNVATGNYVAAVNSLLSGEYLARLSNENRIALADIEQNYRQVTQLTATTGTAFTGAINQLTQIMTDPNLDAVSKQNAINDIVASLATSLQAIGSINGVDFGDLLDFEETATEGTP